jgi:hypothetical protein
MSHMSSCYMNLVRVSLYLYLYQIIPVFFVFSHMNIVRVSLYCCYLPILMSLVFLHVFIGFFLNLLSIPRNLNTHSYVRLFIITILVIYLQITILTVFANASPSLRTYPVSPAHRFPLLKSVYWSLIYGF